MIRTPTVRQRAILEAIADAETCYGSLACNRRVPRRDVLRLVRRGFVRSVGRVRLMLDEDTPIRPARYAEGFIVTRNGRPWVP